MVLIFATVKNLNKYYNKLIIQEFISREILLIGSQPILTHTQLLKWLLHSMCTYMRNF